jgi:hypothetical protein
MSPTTEARSESVAAERKGTEPRRFRPRLSVGYHQDLHALVSATVGRSFEERIRLIRSSIDTAETRRMRLRELGVGADDMLPTVVYLASLRVLRDLTLQGWTPGVDDDGVYVLPPMLAAVGDDPSEAKTGLRDSFRFILADHLLSPSVASFVRSMEQHGIAKVFADGPEVARRSGLGRTRVSGDVSIAAADEGLYGCRRLCHSGSSAIATAPRKPDGSKGRLPGQVAHLRTFWSAETGA